MRLAKWISPSGQVELALAADGPWRHVPGVLSERSLSDWLEDPDLQTVVQRWSAAAGQPVQDDQLIAPVDQQEVWAAGVTYRRSQSARMEESEAAASCYDRVYASPRPELFLKATAHRVVGPGQDVRIRADAHWNVPEPELALVLNSRLELVGFTIGNDMSSRDIEGENPLYLPQAKVYDQCCAVGPCITLAGHMPKIESVAIALRVQRGSEIVFAGDTSVAQMARSFAELIGWLGRDNSFPAGAMLLTGTGVVPPREFSLQPGDDVMIEIDGIGVLRNRVVQRTT